MSSKKSDEILFTTSDGVNIKFGETYYFVSKKWMGTGELNVFSRIIDENYDINKKASITYGIKENAEKDAMSLLEYANILESDSFVGWSEEAINGYLTACKSIKEKIISINKILENV
jgi:hypothetical protein